MVDMVDTTEDIAADGVDTIEDGAASVALLKKTFFLPIWKWPRVVVEDGVIVEAITAAGVDVMEATVMVVMAVMDITFKAWSKAIVFNVALMMFSLFIIVHIIRARSYTLSVFLYLLDLS
jgi:hypothetical protein